MPDKPKAIVGLTVLVAALGYFVDIYDLLLFNIVRVQSLRDLGLSETLIRIDGEFIISFQMYGLLIGGIIWGVMADKRGRLSVLFGSIILYSLANFANAAVQDTTQYAWVRFFGGIGLAGELGAGITLVSEMASKEKRGISTSLVAGIGLMGAVVAFFISQHFHWRTCYLIGGGLGICLLVLRVSVAESGMFHSIKQNTSIARGNFLMFFNNRERMKKYILAILIGLPTWYVIGILVAFSNDFAKAFGLDENINPGKATMYAYVAISIGDVCIGFVSQELRSRKKALYLFYGFTIVALALFFSQKGGSAFQLYVICAALGFSTGFWAIFVTMAAEQFGTNLRATAATTVPNMVRGALPIMLLLFNLLQKFFSYQSAALYTGIIVMTIGFLAAVFSQETFNKDLDYIEN